MLAITQPLAAYKLPEGHVQIAFSGGRTSAMMLHHLLEANGPLPSDRMKVIFGNTGREMPETLDFVAECARRWAVPVIWLEWQAGEHGMRYRQVGHDTAARAGEPFESLIRSKGYLPNRVARYCTSELKIRPGRDYLRSLGWDHWSAAVGLRFDEPARWAKDADSRERWTRWLPLVDAHVTKGDVTAFWNRQPFDLALQTVGGRTPYGNCCGCFLKSEATQAALARDHPERHAWWERMETLATTTAGSPATFRAEYSKFALRRFVERQGDLLTARPDILCQADSGECL